jgi:ATP-dependent RNA helicase DeaD
VELAEKLEARGYSAAALNGDLNQQMRERTIEQLKNGQLDIVIATDVAARGIDVARVTHVINYDIPYDAEAYVHRIGRTGRAGRAGTAILFVAPREIRMLRTIERVTRQAIAPLTLPSRQAVTDKRISLFKQQISDVLDAEDLSFFEDIVVTLEQEKNVGTHEIAAALAFLVQKERPLRPKEREAEPVRAERFDRERSERPPFDPKDSKARFERGAPRGDRAERSERTERPDRSERGEWTERPPREDRPDRGERTERTDRTPRDRSAGPAPGMATYRIEVGREHGVQPKNIVGAIANESGLPSRLIGRINLLDTHSTVDLPDDLSADIVQRLKRTWVCQQQLNIVREAGAAAVSSGNEGPREGGSRPPRKAPPVGGAKPWEGRGGDRGDRGERPERKPFGDRPPFGGNRGAQTQGQGYAGKPKKRSEE